MKAGLGGTGKGIAELIVIRDCGGRTSIEYLYLYLTYKV